MDREITEKKLKEAAKRYGLDIELYSQNPGIFVDGEKKEVDDIFEDFFTRERDE